MEHFKYNIFTRRAAMRQISAWTVLWLFALSLRAQRDTTPVPTGFTPSRPAEYYGTTQKKLQNGAIYEYMDGGAIVYEEHGFRALEHREYADAGKHAISLDIFTLGSEKDALAALADERIVPPDGSGLAIKLAHKAFHFPPDYFVYLVKGDRFYYFHIDDDRLSGALDTFIAAVLTKDSAAPPSAVR